MTQSTKDQTEKLARLSSDCSYLLTHLIRKNNKDILTDNDASKILQLILNINNHSKNPMLIGGNIGWYGACGSAKLYQPYTNDHFLAPTETKGVCFTDSTLAGLRAHRKVFQTKHGLAFDREFLYQQGANPCLNIRDSLLRQEIDKAPPGKYNHVYNFIPQEIAGFVNIIHESFDSTHEREWRILGNFDFIYSDIKFIFCPEDEFEIFSAIQTKGLPALFDLMWLDRV
ncbi:MAG TPA: hypothetical protein VLI69_06525 [Gammaproteobacteria bacterium]|nr:hypothetical protein [Gammaproteobacteria bacterium]